MRQGFFWVNVLVLFGVCFAEDQGQNATRTKVLILGAGLSGLTAAETLLENGVTDFLVLDGDAALGGRVKSVDFHGVRINLGANWIHFVDEDPGKNEGNVIWTLKEKYNLTGALSDFDDLAAFDDSGEVTDPAKVANDELHSVRQSLQSLYHTDEYRKDNCLKLMSIRSGLEKDGWDPKTPIEQAVEYWKFDAEFADPPDVTSLDSMLFLYDGNPGEDFFVVDERGFDVIFRETKEKIGDRLRLGQNVTKIIRNNTGDIVTVRTHDSSYTADYVICTFGIGVLKSGDVEFVPPLDGWKLDEIHKFRTAWYTKIFLKFPDGSPFWSDTEWILYVSSRRGYYPVFGNLQATGLLPSDKNVLLVLVSGDESHRIENQPDQTTKSEIMAVLREMYGSSIPDAEDIYVTKWGVDPFQYGSYSNWPVDVTPECFERLQAPAGRVLFAGEATHEKYNGYLQGAYLTGRDRANDVIACLSAARPTVTSDNPEPPTPCPSPYKPKYQIEGCLYEDALNYNPNATVDDGSCDFGSATSVSINGSLLFFLVLSTVFETFFP